MKKIVLLFSLAVIVGFIASAQPVSASTDEVSAKKREAEYADRANALRKETDPAVFEAKMQQLLYDFKIDTIGKQNAAKLTSLYGLLAPLYAGAGNYAKFEEFAFKMPDKVMQARCLSEIAGKLAQKNENIEWATGLAKRALTLLDAARIDSSSRPSRYTVEQWAELLDFCSVLYGDTYAFLLYRQGAYNDALKYQQKIIERAKSIRPAYIEHYALYLDKTGQQDKAMEVLENTIKAANYNLAIKEHFKQLFTAKNGQAAYASYDENYNKEYKKSLIKSLKEKMLDKQAPDFTLKNIEGKDVSLKDYIGKVVILDFWATWCGPCVMSFPDMHTAVKKYADDKEAVVFLFINMEGSSNSEQKVKDFIANKKLPFHVLLDDAADKEKRAGMAFGISGIPHKLVIDKKGVIRFSSVGYNDNSEQMLAELYTMIELAAQG